MLIGRLILQKVLGCTGICVRLPGVLSVETSLIYPEIAVMPKWELRNLRRKMK